MTIKPDININLMHIEANNRIIILPFTLNENIIGECEIANIIFHALLLHLSSINSIKIINLKFESYKRLAQMPNDQIKNKELKNLGNNNNAKYALNTFINLNDSNNICLNLKIFNLAIPDIIEDWQFDNIGIIYLSKNSFDTNIEQFNSFRKELINKILLRLDIQPDKTIKEYLETDYIKNITAFSYLIKAMDLSKLADERLMNIQKAIDLSPEMEILYLEMGKILKAKRNYKEAIASFILASKKISLNYIKSLTCHQLGLCYSLIGNDEEAVKNWIDAIEYYKDYITPYFNLALFYEESQDFNNAEKYFLEIQMINPEDSRTYINLARLYSKSGNWLKAIDEYNKHIQKNPYDAWSLSNIGNCYLQLKKNNDAKNFFIKTIELDPDGEAGNYAKQVLDALEEASKKDWWKFWKK